MALPRTAPAPLLAEYARAAKIANRETSEREQWEPNAEQMTTWSLMRKHNRVIIAKPRKTGISTAVLFDDLLWTHACDDSGNRVRCVFAIDSADKTREHFDRAHAWARDLGLPCTPKRSPPFALIFANGSRLDFLTMGTDEPGRGGDIFRLHVTELPYAGNPENAWHALRSACMDKAQIIVETTMTSADPHTKAMWQGQKRDEATKRTIPVATDFVRHFFKVTDQTSYRLPIVAERGGSTYHRLELDDGAEMHVELDAEAWAYCKTQGFADGQREAAAWWWLHCLPNICNGDVLKLMHDYPQHEPHLFVATSGRYILLTPDVAETLRVIPVHGLSGNTWPIDVYVEPRDCSGNVFVTVDTAGGKNRTRSVVLATDIASGEILAAFASSMIVYDDLARVASMVRHTYLENMKQVKRPRCELHVEVDGGWGAATGNELSKIGTPWAAIEQSKNAQDNGADVCMRYAKRQIETRDKDGKSVVAGPPELADECDVISKEGGTWKGLKDVLMTFGMALLLRERQGVVDKSWRRARYDPKRIIVEDRMREQRLLARGHYGRRV